MTFFVMLIVERLILKRFGYFFTPCLVKFIILQSVILLENSSDKVEKALVWIQKAKKNCQPYKLSSSVEQFIEPLCLLFALSPAQEFLSE